MSEVILSNAQIILPTEVITGSLVLRDGKIAAIDPGTTRHSGAVECDGDFVAPGLVELHTDNLERHMTPRPGVDWPHANAIIAHDAELAGVGITTVFDALRIGSEVVVSAGKPRYNAYARQMATEILQMRARGALRISHFLHLRAEVCSETLPEEIDAFTGADRIGIVSLMDHTPGQRQFSDLTQLRTYMKGKHQMSDADFDAHIARRRELGDRVRTGHVAAAVAGARRLGAILASHDDTTADHVATSRAQGVRIAEFPTTMAAAQACHAAGIGVMMGAPNLIRGGSHSGNVAAAELAGAGVLDILSSDYVPAALLMAAVSLGTSTGDMAYGMRMVTQAPAQAAGLDDRGALQPGLRADVVRFATVGGAAVVRGVWAQGRRVA